MANAPKPQGHHIWIFLDVAIEIKVEQAADPPGVEVSYNSGETSSVQ